MLMQAVKRVTGSPRFRKALGVMVAEHLRLVWKTSRVVIEPEDIFERGLAEVPVILAMWHGQHFLTPFLKNGQRSKVLISRHFDGDINAAAAEHLGIEVIRGSGAHRGDFGRKGGVPAFYEMLEALKQGYSIASTADVPKKSRIAGRGIVALAAVSGRPIFVVAIATRNRITFNSWDRAALNLPFGRAAFVGAGPIRVPPDAGEAAIEESRQAVEAGLNAVTARAYAIVDGRG